MCAISIFKIEPLFHHESPVKIQNYCWHEALAKRQHSKVREIKITVPVQVLLAWM